VYDLSVVYYNIFKDYLQFTMCVNCFDTAGSVNCGLVHNTHTMYIIISNH